MEVTALELNQQTAEVLACVQAGETVTVTKNGLPVAVLRPYGLDDPAVYPFGTDPMDVADTAPAVQGGSGFYERVEDLLAGFGSDD